GILAQLRMPRDSGHHAYAKLMTCNVVLESGHPMLEKTNLSSIEWILLLTAFAAGSVDVISFATLGGVFASAMTGNFALLAYYVAQGDAPSAMGSNIAVESFVVGWLLGVLQRPCRPKSQGLGFLLGSGVALLLFFALY